MSIRLSSFVTPRERDAERDAKARSCHPEVATARFPDFRFVLRSAFPVTQWPAGMPCCVVPSHSSGGCAGISPASLRPSELASFVGCALGLRSRTYHDILDEM